jgi:hypothetical protein
LRQLAEALHHLIYGAFRYQPNHVIGGGKNPWSHHTFAYIWGGGAAHPAYEQTFLQTLQSLRIGVNDANRLPRPSDHFVLPSDVDFGRLAVAYGLSFHKANLESVRLPSELKTFDQLYPAYWHEVINTEKICTCRGNPACLRCYGLGLIRPDTSIAPALDAGVMQPVPRPAIQKSRVQIALEKCVCKYHAFEARRPFLIERFLLLDRIRQLRRLPEIDDASLIRQQAEAILLFNVRRFKGRVRVLKHSAKRVNDGCRCVVDGQHRESYADVVVHGPPQQIEKLVNGGDQHRSVDLFCCLNRTERNEFILEFEDLATFR